MLPMLQEEGVVPDALLVRVVVYKLCRSKHVIPGVSLGPYITSQHVIQRAIHPLSLPIRLWMEGSRYDRLDVRELAHLCPELAYN